MIYNKTVNGITTWYLWDGNKLLAEYSNTGTQQKRYTYLPNKIAPIQMTDSTGIYNVHSNHLETPILITNSANQIVWRANHESFGKAVINDDVDGNGNRITFNIRFPGQYYDAETGLHYNRYRYYDPGTGRYITSDPIGLRGGINTYIYANVNPMRYIDMLGLEPPNWLVSPSDRADFVDADYLLGHTNEDTVPGNPGIDADGNVTDTAVVTLQCVVSCPDGTEKKVNIGPTIIDRDDMASFKEWVKDQESIDPGVCGD